MSKIWFTSDLHFCHDRDFIYGPRGFKSVQEMNEAIGMQMLIAQLRLGNKYAFEMFKMMLAI